MPADEEPVSMAEVSAFLAETLPASRSRADIEPAELLVYIERKADLLTRIADRDGTDEALSRREGGTGPARPAPRRADPADACGR